MGLLCFVRGAIVLWNMALWRVGILEAKKEYQTNAVSTLY